MSCGTILCRKHFVSRPQLVKSKQLCCSHWNQCLWRSSASIQQEKTGTLGRADRKSFFETKHRQKMQIQWMWDVKSEVLLWEVLANGKQREFLGVGKRSHYFQDEQLRENPSSKSTLDKVYQGFQTPQPWSTKTVSVVLGHTHCVPCCTDIRGCSRTGGNARVFNIFAMENSTWKLYNLGSDLFRGSKETFNCNFSFGGSWRSLNLMEIMSAWHLLALELGLKAECSGRGSQTGGHTAQ